MDATFSGIQKSSLREVPQFVSWVLTGNTPRDRWPSAGCLRHEGTAGLRRHRVRALVAALQVEERSPDGVRIRLKDLAAAGVHYGNRAHFADGERQFHAIV